MVLLSVRSKVSCSSTPFDASRVSGMSSPRSTWTSRRRKPIGVLLSETAIWADASIAMQRKPAPGKRMSDWTTWSRSHGISARRMMWRHVGVIEFVPGTSEPTRSWLGWARFRTALLTRGSTQWRIEWSQRYLRDYRRYQYRSIPQSVWRAWKV